MTIPYIGFGNDELADLATIKEGDEVMCPRCNGRHRLVGGTSEGKRTTLLMFYECNGATYLGALNGKLVAHVKPSISGEI